MVDSNIIGSTASGAATNSIRFVSGSTAVGSVLIGISLGASTNSTVLVAGNIVKNMSNSSTANTTGTITGITSAAVSPAVINIINDSVSNCAFSTNVTSGTFSAFANTGTASTIIFRNNTVSSNSFPSGMTGAVTCFSSAGACAALTINHNTIISNTTSATGSLFYAVNSASAVTTSLSIDSNSIGNSSAGPITFPASTVAHVFINNTAGAAGASIDISNNDFQGISYSSAGSGTSANTYISNTGATGTQNINNNTFTNLNVNTGGGITFISNVNALPASGTRNVNNNKIVTRI